MKKILAIALCLVMVLSLLPTVSFAAEQSITLDSSSLLGYSGSNVGYSDSSKEVDGVTFSWKTLGAYPNASGKLQWKKGDGEAQLWNSTEIPGNITKIVLTYSSAHSPSNKHVYDVYFGTTAQGKTETKKLTFNSSETTYTVTPDSGYSYFWIYSTSSAAAYFDSIKVYYSAGDAHTHDWDNGKVTTAATCTTKGVKTYTCKLDSTHTKTEEIDALGHNFGADGKCTNTGCAQEGVIASLVANITDGMKVVIYNKSTAAVVGGKDEKYTSGSYTNTKVEYVPAYKWDYSTGEGDWIVTQVDAVLTVKVNTNGTYSFLNSEGKYLYAAQYDTKFVTAEDVATDNKYTTFTLEEVTHGWNIKSVDYQYINKTTQVSTDQYLEFYNGMVKLWTNDGTGVFLMNFYQVCTHTDTEKKNVKEATCVDKGYTGDTVCKDCGTKISSGEEIPATGIHTGGTATCTKKAVCTVCGQEYGELGEHSGELKWDDQGVGHIQKYLGCGCTVGEVEAHDHDGDNGVCSKCGHGCVHTGGEATCKSPAICETCGNPYGEKNADNHKGETELTGKVDATCGKDGYTGDTVCKDCGKTISKGEVVPATGNHADGNKDHKCDVCEKVLSECADTDNDHKCDVCEKVLSECVDTDKDGKCDICGATVETKPDEKEDDSKEDEKPVVDPNNITGQLVTSLKDGMHIIIYNPGDGVIATGREYTYEKKNDDGTIASSKQELETAAATVSGKTLTAAKADACVLTVKRVNGHYSFVTSDGKYLYMDSNEVKFVDKAGDYTLFDLEKADGGYYIKSVNAVYSYTDKNTDETVNKPQYLELYNGYLTVYSLNTSKANIYTFNFYTTDEVSDNTGDPIAVVLGLLAVSGLGITVLKKKEH